MNCHSVAIKKRPKQKLLCCETGPRKFECRVVAKHVTKFGRKLRRRSRR
jgi:hypothetical protein